MSLGINTNLSALTAQRNLSGTSERLQTAIQRLSSGLRINSARDDAAGLAISERMTAQVKGLNQATRNANDGISLAQTAEGALAQVSNNLQRIRELAIQSANGTNSSSDRAALDAEATQLTAEITRVADQTSFNGIALLNGSFTAQAFQIGASANQTISITSIADSRSTGLGSNILLAGGTAMNLTQPIAAAVPAATTAAQTAMTVNTVNGGTTAAFTIAAASSAKAIADAINTNAASVGVTATASNSATLSSLSVAGTVTFTLGGTASAAISAVVADATDLTALVGAINGAAGTTKVTATFTSTSAKNSITLTSSDGSDITIADYANTGGAGAATLGFSGVTLDDAGNDSSRRTGSVSLDSSKGAITLGGGAQGTVFNSLTSSFSSMASITLNSAANAQLAIAVVDAALSQVNVSRGDLGAYQNRFSSAVASLQTTSENVQAARSRILDADFAQETGNLTKASITQQAGVAMLAQANALPQQVLALLRG